MGRTPAPVRLHGHSCEAMPELSDGSVDLIVTSPPYWVDPEDPLLKNALLQDGERRTPDSYGALLSFLSECFAECWRTLKPGGFACVNIASTRVKGKLYPLPFDLSVRLLASGWELQDEIVWRRWRGWDKRGGVVIQHPYPGYFYPNRVFEYVLVFRKPGPPIQEGRSEEAREASRIAVDHLLLHEVNNSIWNVLPVQPRSRARSAAGVSHPCPFPDELAYRLVTLYSYVGDRVLDPFAGSGTTGKVARLTGRRFVGYEVNPAFLALAQERITEPTVRRERRVCRFEELPEATGTPSVA
jgi:modification methylase